MDKEGWWATYTVWGHKRIRHDLVTKQEQPCYTFSKNGLINTIISSFRIWPVKNMQKQGIYRNKLQDML